MKISHFQRKCLILEEQYELICQQRDANIQFGVSESEF